MKAFMLLILGLLVSCGSYPQQSSLKGLGYSGAGKNVAILIGAPNGLSGVPTDIRELTKVFQDPSYGFRFEVKANGSASRDALLTLTKESVSDAESLFWYFSGHGGNGTMSAQGSQSFTFNQVVTAIKSVRTTPLKRLVVMIDSCLSGSFVDGSSAIITETEAEDTVYQYIDRDPALYEQAFVMSASKKNENSMDLGSRKGGAFTYALRMVMADTLKNQPLATFRDVAESTIVKTQDEGDHTPVYKGFPSAEVLNDYMFLYRM